MRLGDVVNGYRLTTTPTNAGAGMSQWAFGEKGGVEHFVKMFLAPKHPSPDTPGSDEVKERKLAACLAFERRHLEIQSRIDPAAPGGGNLVATQDFFRIESSYYKVTEKVEAVDVPPFETLTPRQRIVLLRTLVFSVSLLHGREIVHGDLKVDNVMIQPAGDALYTTKLIDFDEAYITGSPPSPELIVGDPSYYSPELFRYIKRDPTFDPDTLGTASDMFSLGLLLHALLCGGPPEFDRARFDYPCEVAAAGQVLDHSAAPPPLAAILRGLAAPEPGDRPTITDLIGELRGVDPEALQAIRTVRPPAPLDPRARRALRSRGGDGPRRGDDAPAAPSELKMRLGRSPASPPAGPGPTPRPGSGPMTAAPPRRVGPAPRATPAATPIPVTRSAADGDVETARRLRSTIRRRPEDPARTVRDDRDGCDR